MKSRLWREDLPIAESGIQVWRRVWKWCLWKRHGWSNRCKIVTLSPKNMIFPGKPDSQERRYAFLKRPSQVLRHFLQRSYVWSRSLLGPEQNLVKLPRKALVLIRTLLLRVFKFIRPVRMKALSGIQREVRIKARPNAPHIVQNAVFQSLFWMIVPAVSMSMMTSTTCEKAYQLTEPN